jgi:predicted nucleic acid-binding protein
LRFAFIPDSSAALSWCFEDEATPETEALLNRLKAGETALVPAHWPFEVGNVLVHAVRRRRIERAKQVQFIVQLRRLPIRVDAESATQALQRSLVLAERHGLTVYDAAYLELALRMSLPLASFDQDLRKAAKAEGTLLLC